MPGVNVNDFFRFPELEIVDVESSKTKITFFCRKSPMEEYCPRCAKGSDSTYDHRIVRIRDSPIQDRAVELAVVKRRLYCKVCRKPFTEPIPGVRKGHRYTLRFGESLLKACHRYSNLSDVVRDFQCSSGTVYRFVYRELAREVKERANYEWPTKLGIDEHSFQRDPKTGFTRYVTMLVDHDHARVREVALGKSGEELSEQLANVPGRENVAQVSMDMSEGYRSFVHRFFPKAKIITDKFHVVRLLTPALFKHRKEVTGTRVDARSKRLLTAPEHKLKWSDRMAIRNFLGPHDTLKELYEAQQSIYRLYRIRGHSRAEKRLEFLIQKFRDSEVLELKRLSRTLRRWKEEILNYFLYPLTNARTEGFNNKAKLVKRRGYGYKSFFNYRLRVLHACF